MDSSLPWYRSTLCLSLLGSVLLWAALPPLAIAPLAWIAPVPWLILVGRKPPLERRFYLAIYAAAFAFWLAAIHWLRLPHPALYVGWLALSAYLACYLPAFVALSRVAVHRLGVPLWIAAPVVWTGLELARAHVMTGFLMGSIAHSQARWPVVIQISDIAGEYGMSFVILFVAACLASAFYPRWRPVALVPGVLTLGAVVGYGAWRISEASKAPEGDAARPVTRIALIQGNSLADWKMDADKQRQIMEEYIGLSKQAVAMAKDRGDGRALDLVVWPETMFRTGLTTFEEGYQLPADVGRSTEEISAYGPADLASLAKRLDTAVLVGIDRIHFAAADAVKAADEPARYTAYNSSVFVTRDGKIQGTYDKQHLVVFGEYVPFAKWFPVLNRLSSVTGIVEAGAKPVSFELNGVFYAPNICYETAVPHVIRRQVETLNRQNRSPDVLVNLTNDAWYWGSSELDMHLACGIFRAVETRTPLVVAANGGISVWIDSLGRVRAESPKQETAVILADVELGRSTNRSSWYVRLGDWLAGACLAACIGLAIYGWWTRARGNERSTS